MSLFSALRSDRRGNVTILVAGGLAMLCGMAALGIDTGMLFLEKRRLQGVVDAAALAAAADPAIARASAEAALLVQSGSPVTLGEVQRGEYTPDPALGATMRFTPSSSGSAVRIGVSTVTPTYFARALGFSTPVTIVARATAARIELAAFSIGSRVAAVDGGLPNAILSAVVGTDLRLTLVDYNDLIGGRVDLLRFVEGLRAELHLDGAVLADVLRATPTLPQVLRSAANATDDPAAAAVLMALAGRVPAAPVALDRLIDLGPLGQNVRTGGSPPIRIEAFNLLRALLELGGRHDVSAATTLGIPGLADVRIRAAVGERAAHSPWLAIGAARQVIVRTSQARIALDVGLLSAAPLGLGQVRVPLLIELAPAEATLTEVTCAGGRARTRATVDVTPSAGTAAIADHDTGAFAAFDRSLALRPAIIARAPLVSVTAFAELQLGRRTRSIAFDAAAIAAGTPQTVTTDDIATALVHSLVQRVTLRANVLGLSIDATLITTAVGSLLAAAAEPLDQLLDQVTTLAGVRLGQVDVWVNGVRCGTPVLVG